QIIFGFYSMNAIEAALVLGLVTVLVALVAREEPRLWSPFGLLAGLAVLNKHTAGIYAGALVAALALTPQRRLLRSRWLLVGGALALLVFSPNLRWQLEHHFASIEFYHNATAFKNIATPPWKVVLDQLISSGPGSG